MPTTTYTFDSDSQGWRIWNADTQSFQSVSATNFSQASFSGGVLQYGDVNATAGQNAFLATPSDLSGDQRGLVEGDVSFRFRNIDTEAFTPDATASSVDVILVSNSGTTITASVPLTPTTGTVDQTINVSLDAATFGVSQAAFDAVMGDLSFFGIDGNSRALAENTVIDNVTFTPSATPNGAVDGTHGDDAMPVGFVDETGDVIDGSANDIRGYAGEDTIDGGGGDDTIDGGDGADSITGGDGRDTLLGGAGDDTINTFSGGAGFEIGGNNVGTADYVDAGAGNDSILAGFGVGETIEGGDGNDTFSASHQGGPGSFANLDLAAGTYSTNSGGSGTLSGIENVTGSQAADRISGDANANQILGEGGSDTLLGGAGDDTIDGGTGDDTLTGGYGDDVFVFADGSGGDTISDFDMGDDDADGIFNDQIDVTGLTDPSGNPVNAKDVTVVDDGFGNAQLIFPNGEYLILKGIAPSQIDEASELFSAGIPCFTRGSQIRVPGAETAVEKLRIGDLVETLDCGPQPIVWIGKRRVSARQLRSSDRHRPICIPKGALNNHKTLFVSPQHGMLLDQRHGISGQAFARAKHLAEAFDDVHIDARDMPVTYYHILCAQHQVLFANGAATESFYPGFEGVQAFALRNLAELLQVLPGLLTLPTERCYGPRARVLLKRKDVIRLASRSNSEALAGRQTTCV